MARWLSLLLSLCALGGVAALGMATGAKRGGSGGSSRAAKVAKQELPECCLCAVAKG